MERKLIAAAVSSALVLPMAAQAVEFSVSGHINRAIVSVDGGGKEGMEDTNDGTFQHKDSNASQTRFRFTGSEELENGMTTGVNLEYGGIGPINSRHANVYLSTAGGKISVGHIGEYEADVAMVAETNQTVTGKQFMGALEKDGFKFNAAGELVSGPGGVTTAGALTDVAVLAAHEKLNMVKVTPIDAADALTPGDLYNKNVAGKAAGTEDAGDITTASAAVSFGQGTSIALSWSQDDVRNTDYHYAKLDHSYGAGSVSVYYKQGEREMVGPSTLKFNGGTAAYDVVKGKSMTHEGSLWGLAIGHDLGGGANAYAGYRRIEEDGMNDVDLLVAGLRVSFN